MAHIKLQCLQMLSAFVALTECQYAHFEEGKHEEMILTPTMHAMANPSGFELSTSTNILLPFTLQPLPLGSIQPVGWLKDQMQLMASGLAGHQYEFYKYVAHSSWLGGNEEYSELNEAFPYWYNGIVPLAYALDDPMLKEQVHTTTSYVLAHQADDGWIGPETGTKRNFWARYPLFMGMTMLVEANATWEVPVLNALHSFVVLMHDMLADNYKGYVHHDGDEFSPFDYTWGQVRAQDLIVTLQWMYEKHPRHNSGILLESMHYLYNASMKWEDWYNGAVYIKEDLWTVPTIHDNDFEFPYEHGVNAGQGLKAPAVIHRFTQNASLLTTAMDGVNWTFTYHGAASGTILADERLAGLSPYSGSELCTVVETMYSLSYLYQAVGNPYYADLAELGAFNALPAMLTPDWWAHQYVAQPNQPWSKDLGATPFYNVISSGQTFGLEPDYPCCTVNHVQGYPKFLAATFVGVGKNGLGHALLSPANVTTVLASGKVSVMCSTNYPFGSVLSYAITSKGPFDFYVRVPAWYIPETSSIQFNHDSAVGLSPSTDTGLHKISVPGGHSTITYTLGSATIIEPRANDTVAIHHGALLFALEINSTSSSTFPGNYPSGTAPTQARDWTITNTSQWSVAIDTSTLKYHTSSDIDKKALANPIFAPSAPPVYMTVKACEIDWPLFKGVPGAAPAPAKRTCIGAPFVAKLVPYGSAKLHMSELPTVDLPSHI